MFRSSHLLLILSLLSAPFGSADEARDKGGHGKLDVLFVTYCTMRADFLGAYGSEMGLSPNLDLLASESQLLEAHYTQASFSGAAFATMISGLDPAHHGVYDHPMRLDDDLHLIGEVFAQAGYSTGAFLRHDFLQPQWSYDQGFDHFEGQAQAAKRPQAPLNGALEWLATLEEDRPMLLWYQSHWGHFIPRPTRPLDEEMHAARVEIKDLIDEIGRAPLMFDPSTRADHLELWDRVEHLYRLALKRSDEELGLLIQALSEAGRLERTVIVVSSDHGEAIGEWGQYFNHDANLSEATIRVPAFIKIPGRDPSRIAQISRHVDLLPTLCAVVGVDCPQNVDGVDLSPAFSGEELGLVAFAESRTLVAERAGFATYPLHLPGIEGKLRMVRKGDLKLVERPQAKGVEHQLFDLSEDPTEQRDLAAKRPEDLRRLARLLRAWFGEWEGVDGESLDLDAATRSELRSLGYLD